MHPQAYTLKSLEGATELAIKEGYAGTPSIPCDLGPNVSPRYDVIPLPKIGDPVSKYINGDYYPEGYITKISSGPLYRRIETSTGLVFWRRGQSSTWLAGGVWGMVMGHIDKRNPSF